MGRQKRISLSFNKILNQFPPYSPKNTTWNSNTTADDVTYLSKRAPNKKQATSNAAVDTARRTGGGVTVDQKFSGGGNTQKKSDRNNLALDNETEKMTQKELATKINEKPQIVQEYENGKAIPNSQVTNKIQKALGIYISGKNAGQPFGARGSKK